MKALKYCRTASFVPMMAFLIVFFVYRTLDKGFDGIIIFGSVSLYTRIKNENDPAYLAKNDNSQLRLYRTHDSLVDSRILLGSGRIFQLALSGYCSSCNLFND